MAIDEATAARIAKLARIKVAQAELPGLAAELSTILTFVEQLSEVDTADVAPMTSAVAATLPWRTDQVADGGYADAVLSNAPEETVGFFVVPKVVE